MMKKSFTLLLTILLVIFFAILSVQIMQNRSLNSTIDTQQVGYTQALYHMKFCEKLLLDKIDIDINITNKIIFENIPNHKIEAIITKKDSKTLQIDLTVESLLYKNIRLHQRFLKSLI